MSVVRGKTLVAPALFLGFSSANSVAFRADTNSSLENFVRATERKNYCKSFAVMTRRVIKLPCVYSRMESPVLSLVCWSAMTVALLARTARTLRWLEFVRKDMR